MRFRRPNRLAVDVLECLYAKALVALYNAEERVRRLETLAGNAVTAHTDTREERGRTIIGHGGYEHGPNTFCSLCRLREALTPKGRQTARGDVAK